MCFAAQSGLVTHFTFANLMPLGSSSDETRLRYVIQCKIWYNLGVMKMNCKIKSFAALVSAMFLTFANAARVDVYPQSFDAGGWSLDAQFMDVMGSPYLLAHGLGVRVTDAKAYVSFPEQGTYRVWVRTRNWAEGNPGRFRVLVDGKPLPKVFGEGSNEWTWEDGGSVKIERSQATVALEDLTGFDGRCAGIVFTTDLHNLIFLSVEIPYVFAVLFEAAKAKFLLCKNRVCLAKNAKAFFACNTRPQGGHGGSPPCAFFGSFLSRDKNEQQLRSFRTEPQEILQIIFSKVFGFPKGIFFKNTLWWGQGAAPLVP